MTRAALHAEGLTSGYAGAPALRDFDLAVEPGEVVTVLGANGAGKTTALLTMAGVLRAFSGRVRSFDNDLTGMKIEQVSKLGVALVPDDRGIFQRLTVEENLRLARSADRTAALQEAFGLFPALADLKHRRSGLLSGGEQRMLSLAKALVTHPRVLLVDEMSLGLAPRIVQELLPLLRDLAVQQKMAVVLVEQHVTLALQVSDRAVVLNRGRVVLTDDAAVLRGDRARIEEAYFGT